MHPTDSFIFPLYYQNDEQKKFLGWGENILIWKKGFHNNNNKMWRKYQTKCFKIVVDCCWSCYLWVFLFKLEKEKYVDLHQMDTDILKSCICECLKWIKGKKENTQTHLIKSTARRWISKISITITRRTFEFYLFSFCGPRIFLT